MSETVRPCFVCGGDMVRERTTHYEQVDGELLIFENVPATVCDLCGETTMRGSVFDVIDRIARERPAPTRTVEAAVYDYTALPGAPADVPAAPDTEATGPKRSRIAAPRVTPSA